MIGRQLIDALRQPEPEPPASVPPLESLPPPPGNARILGYAVARYDPYGRTVLTHASLMPLDEARREADAQRRADSRGHSWAVVEVRRVMGP